MVKDAVIVSCFRYENHPNCTQRGLVLPFNSGLYINGAKFYGFSGEAVDDVDDAEQFPSSAIGQVKIACKCSVNCGGMSSYFKGIEWIDSTHK